MKCIFIKIFLIEECSMKILNNNKMTQVNSFVDTKVSRYHIKLADGYQHQINPNKVNPSSQPYLQFSQPSNLDLSHEDRKVVGVFPRHIYTKHPFASSVSHNIRPRDKSTNYTYSSSVFDGKEKSEHTPWQSVYGYDRFPNEYGVGVQSRGYIEPPECNACNFDIPVGMAPARFYSHEHLNTNTSEFRDVQN